MSDAFIELRAIPVAEARVKCGCQFVLAHRDAIDVREVQFVGGSTVLIVPCGKDGHLEIARAVAETLSSPVEGSAMVVRLAERMEEALP